MTAATRGRPLCSSTRKKSDQLQAASRRLAALCLELERDFLPFRERHQSRFLHGRDVHEHILAAVGGLNETKAFFSIEPLNGSGRHRPTLLSQASLRQAANPPPCRWGRTIDRI